MRKALQRLELGIEELILAALILIEVFDFLALLPPALEYGEKIISILAMCYLFYKASLTKIIFGEKERNYDFLIIVAYLALSMKTIVGFVLSAAKEESLVQGIYALVLKNAFVVEMTGFWIGGMMLILVAYFLIHEKVTRPSILSMIREDKVAKRLWQKTTRFVSIYIILLAIFVTVFTFAMEWIALTIDAAILVIILLFFLFAVAKRKHGMKTESFIKKVSDYAEEFYERFIALFHARKTITVAVAGLLVLHLLVEIGNFIIPYTTGLFYTWYFEQLGAGHTPLGVLMVQDFSAAGTIPLQLGVMAVYLLNVIAVLALFFGPAYAWLYLYNKKKVRLPNILWLFFGSVTAMLLLPVIKMGATKTLKMLGTDITTQQITNLGNILSVLLISVLVMGIFYLLGRKNLGRTTKLAFIPVFLYFAAYIYYFFTSLAKYYIYAVEVMAKSGQYFIAFHLLLFFMITIIFYAGGFVMFAYESWTKQKI